LDTPARAAMSTIVGLLTLPPPTLPAHSPDAVPARRRLLYRAPGQAVTSGAPTGHRSPPTEGYFTAPAVKPL